VEVETFAVVFGGQNRRFIAPIMLAI